MAHKRNDFLKEIRNLDETQLREKLNELRNELVKLRTQVTMGTIKDTMAIRNTRRNIARILTVLNEKGKRK